MGKGKDIRPRQRRTNAQIEHDNRKAAAANAQEAKTAASFFKLRPVAESTDRPTEQQRRSLGRASSRYSSAPSQLSYESTGIGSTKVGKVGG